MCSIDLDGLLAQFFQPPNELNQHWLNTSRSKMAELARKTLCINRDKRFPLFLPLRIEDSFGWYVICPPSLDPCEIRSELQAFVGVSYSRSPLTNYAGKLNSAYKPDEVIRQHLPPDSYVYRIAVLNGADVRERNELATVLLTWLGVRERTLPRGNETPQLLGRALRDFYQAIISGSKIEAEYLLANIRERFPMDGLSPVFMEVFLLGEFKDWETILALPDLRHLARIRLPWLVSQSLVKAVYHVHLEPFEAENDLEGAVEAFRSAVVPQYGGLYNLWLGSDEADVLKSFMLMAVSTNPKTLTWRDDVLSACEKLEKGSGYTESLRQAVRDKLVERVEGPSTIDDALAKGDYEAVFRLEQSLPLTTRVAQALIVSATETKQLSHIRRAIEASQLLTKAERLELLCSQVNRLLYEELTQSETEPVGGQEVETWPLDWCEWIDWLSKTNLSPKAQIDRTNELAMQWSFEDFVGGSDNVSRFMSQLEAAFLSSDDGLVNRLRNLFPQIWLFFSGQDRGFPSLALYKLYDLLRIALALDCQVHGLKQADLIVYHELALASLETASQLSTKDQVKLVLAIVQETRDLWDKTPTERSLPIVLDIVDLLLGRRLSESEKSEVQNLVMYVLDVAQRRAQSGRIMPSIHAQLIQIMQELDLTEALASLLASEVPKGEAEGYIVDPLSLLRGKVVVHSLTESTLSRVKSLLEQYGNCSVETNCSKAGNDHLRDLARNADVFVLVTWSAKHAASDFIQMHRGSKPLIRPSGRGSSAILSALVDHIMTNS